MNPKRINFPLIIIISVACVGIASLIFHKKTMDADFLERDFLLMQARHPMVIRGFQFSSYDQEGKNMTIKAVRLRIEKMKKGFLSLAPVRFAKFKNAEIDVYVDQVESEKDLKGKSQKFNYSLKETFTKEALPDDGFENVVALLFEPVEINFYDGKTLITQIQAKKASIKSKNGNVVLQGNVRATSESRSLSTDRLTLLPDTGEITTNHHFVFKTSENNATGKGITTDLLLNPISLKKTNYVDWRKYERKIHSGKTEADTLRTRHISGRNTFVQANSD